MSLQDTIQQFQKLPDAVKQALSSDGAMAKLEAIEKKYNTKLASIVLRAAVKEFPLEDLGIMIKKELKIKPEAAGLLKDEVLDTLFVSVMDYYTNAEEKAPQGSNQTNAAAPMPQAPGRMVSFRLPSQGKPGIPSGSGMMPPKPMGSADHGMPSVPKAPSLPATVQTTVPKPPAPAKPSPAPMRPPVVPPKPPKSRSYFYFDVEDEKDVEVFKKHAAVASASPKDFAVTITNAADRVIASSLVRLSDDVAKKRLQSILMTRFRDIRDSLETKEMLARPVPLGGMGLDAVTIEKIMALAEEEFRKIHQTSSDQRTADEAEQNPFKQSAAEVRGLQPEVVADQQHAVKSETKPTTTSSNPAASPVISQTNIRRERPIAVETDRPKILEVKPASRLVGPLDEIEQTSLRDLRRFKDQPNAFIDRMKERVHLLEEESFEKRVQALNAWRKSPLFQQYLEVVRTALERNVSIPEMVGSIDETQSSFMSLHEWQTINHLNRELKS